MDSLSGTKITLRSPEPSDVDTLFIWENDPTLWPFGSTRAPLSRHQIWQYVHTYDGDIFAQRQLRLIIVENTSNQPVGTLDLYDFDPRDSRANIGIFIAPQFRAKGYATEALEIVSTYAKEILALHQLAALVCDQNRPSIALFKKSGFNSTSCLRSWIKSGPHFHNALIFQRLFP